MSIKLTKDISSNVCLLRFMNIDRYSYHRIRHTPYALSCPMCIFIILTPQLISTYCYVGVRMIPHTNQ